MIGFDRGMHRRRRWLWSLAWLIGCGAAIAHEHVMPPPDLAQRVGFDQRLGAALPLQATFVDADGRVSSLRAWLDGRPAVLVLGYYRCPNLCDTLLQGLARAVRDSGLAPGREAGVLFVGIDPRERPTDAAATRARLGRLAPQARVADWHFLTGAANDIAALAQAIGFRYVYDARIDEYAHPAGAVVVTADGRVSQYLFGADFPPRTLRLALVEASRGRLGTLVDRLVLFCCGYDPATGRYSLLIGRTMRMLGTGFALLLAVVLVVLAWRTRRPA